MAKQWTEARDQEAALAVSLLCSGTLDEPQPFPRHSLGSAWTPSWLSQ